MPDRNVACRESGTHTGTISLNYFKVETAIVKNAIIGKVEIFARPNAAEPHA